HTVQQLANALTPLIQAMQAQQNQQHETSTVSLSTFSRNSHEDPINWLDEFERSANANNITNNRK
ncbi:7225_t:CDS:1, partial [Ambispora gerdemannii]